MEVGIAIRYRSVHSHDALLRQLGEGLAPDTSMLIALVADADIERETSVISIGHGSVIGSTTESDLTAAITKLRG